MNMNADRKFLIISILVVPIIIFLYFLNWRTQVMYGDDLIQYMLHARLNTFKEKIDLLLFAQKYRPIQGLSIHFVTETFQHNLLGYYTFNVVIQSINTIIFAALVNLFLKSPYLSLIFSLIVGLSRFSYFNISQLLNGGPLEGLAITFLLLSVFYILKAILKKENTNKQKQANIIWSIVFANLSMYTHERYIVIFPFLALVLLLDPTLRSLSLKRRLVLALVAIGSIFLNVVIKKYIYSVPFFVGTGGTNIEFSFATALSYLTEGILSIFQINSGPEYLIGIKFTSLPLFEQILVILVVVGILLVFVMYGWNLWKAYARKEKDKPLFFPAFLFLLVLCGFCLVPAIVTIRLEQRWLQASLNIFIILIVIALSSAQFRNNTLKNVLASIFVLLFLWTDFIYLSKGMPNLYMTYAEKSAADFKKAIDNGTIRKSTDKLYIWEKKRDANTESAIMWSLGGGNLFEFYQNKPRELIFADSIYDKNYSFPVSTFRNFDKAHEQIVYVGDKVIDISNEYLRDSLKRFSSTNIDKGSYEKVSYDQHKLNVMNENLDKFQVTGLHNNENGMRWSNGNVSIWLKGDFNVKDTLSIDLVTYMPPICKDILPKITLVDDNNVEYPTAYKKREGDKFRYILLTDKPVNIQKINILSDTINAFPDRRVLSFPFVSLEMRQ
jgi:hypothetical protein